MGVGMGFHFQNVKGFERFFFSFFRKKLFGRFHVPGVMKIRENWLKMIVAHGHFKFPVAHGHFKFLVAHGHLQIPCGTRSFQIKDQSLFTFPKRCFHFQNVALFQNEFSFSKCERFCVVFSFF